MFRFLRLLYLLTAFVLASAGLAAAAQDGQSQPITPDNIQNLERIANLSRGQLLDAFFEDDGATLTVLSTRGIWRFDAADLTAQPSFAPFEGEAAVSVAGYMFTPELAYTAKRRFVILSLPQVGGAPPFEGMFDLRTGARMTTFPGDAGVSIAFTRNMADPAVIEVIDLGTGITQHVLTIGRGRVVDAIISPDGTLVAVLAQFSGEGAPPAAVQLWDAATGQQRAEVALESRRFDRLRFEDSGRLYLSSRDETQVYSVPALDLITSQPYDLFTLSPDGQSAAYIDDANTLILANLSTGETQTTPLAGFRRVVLRDLLFSPDGTRIYAVTGGSAGAVFVVDAASGDLLPGVGGFAPVISAIAFNLDGQQIVAVETIAEPWAFGAYNPGHGLRFYDLPAARDVDFLPTGFTPYRVAISAGGALAYTMPGAIHLLDGGRSFTFADDAIPLYLHELAFRPDGALLATHFDNQLVFLDGATLARRGAVPHVMSRPSIWGNLLLWDDTTLIAAGDAAVRLYDSETFAETAVIEQGEAIWGMAFHPGRRLLALSVGTFDAREIRLWDLSGESPVLRSTFPRREQHDMLGFSPDGSLLVTALPAFGDVLPPTLAIYAVDDGQMVYSLNDCGLPFAFNPSGDRLVCAGMMFDLFVHGVLE